jgi:hypothetical protein
MDKKTLVAYIRQAQSEGFSTVAVHQVAHEILAALEKEREGEAVLGAHNTWDYNDAYLAFEKYSGKTGKLVFIPEVK